MLQPLFLPPQNHQAGRGDVLEGGGWPLLPPFEVLSMGSLFCCPLPVPCPPYGLPLPVSSPLPPFSYPFGPLPLPADNIPPIVSQSVPPQSPHNVTQTDKDPSTPNWIQELWSDNENTFYK
eukprot:TRINITY_DN20656_c0_g1_i2.p2 TRINITY_DN20656_c0_g1~~TRINITY_DN20656_c0_g1_i2.p2  ORF type:complete len:121 (-),score=30.79 TRINITY_DN20656_c0_g1_i2:67-429(-)